MVFADIISSFFLGLLTPLTAVCVIPLYPAFVSFLANNFSGKKVSKKDYAFIGLLVTIGVIVFMIILGLLFTTILQKSLTNVIQIISPIAFFILGIISIFLIFDVDFSKFLPKVQIKTNKDKPLRSAFLFGLFFGAIVLPCNPGFIATFFARALLFDRFIFSMSNFIAFGLGLSAPLFIFSIASGKWSGNIISFLTKNKKKINVISGILMLSIAVYYLFFVFKII
jgi:cytochrome c-type biogenesis protein